MKKIILICLSILHISNLSAQNNKGETAAAVVAGVATVVGAIAVNKDRIKKFENMLERQAVDYVLDTYDFKSFGLSGYRLTKENERKFDPSDVDIKIFGLTTYDTSGTVANKFALLKILSYGWWDVGAPNFDLYDYYLLTKEEWFEMLTIFIDMSSYGDVNQDFLRKALYIPMSKKRQFEKYDLSDPNVKGYYINQDKNALQGLFVLDSENERGIEKIRITKKGVEYKKDDVILFKNIGSKRYEVYDYSDNYKIISTNRSLGIFIKATGELVVLDEDAINAISARFN
ncbi:hypothetical protein N9T06_00810 [Flavobacteriaceae bacterium]|nr:hypothetical protein [Flavobacteriaceae bacterium]